MKSDFQRNVERMLGAIRYGNEADAFLYTRMVARFVFSKKPNLLLPDAQIGGVIEPLAVCPECHEPTGGDTGRCDICGIELCLDCLPEESHDCGVFMDTRDCPCKP